MPFRLDVRMKPTLDRDNEYIWSWMLKGLFYEIFYQIARLVDWLRDHMISFDIEHVEEACEV